MCLAAFALACHDDFALVLAANRDEFFERPSAPMAWWDAGGEQDARPILAGRDLRGGGTWLGLNRQGRLALLTNIRTGRGSPPGVPSRGELVVDWLASNASIDSLHDRARARGHVDYNLVTADLGAPSGGLSAAGPTGPDTTPAWHWTSSTCERPEPIVTAEDGHVFALSNGRLDEPWPKLVALRSRLGEAVRGARSDRPAELIGQVFAALADDRRASDEQLPSTGVPLPVERMLSSAFIRSEDGRYGTRCSTVLLLQRSVGARVIERSFDRQGQISGQIDIRLPGWPG
ncbi:MAG: hypothetical protein RL375_3975 [Pseudomonadota bacterium]